MPDHGRGDNQVLSDISQVSCCCPELRKIILTGPYMRASDYRTVRAMCGGRVTASALSVTRPFLSTGISGTLDVLCECLHKWSPNLEYVKVFTWDNGDECARGDIHFMQDPGTVSRCDECQKICYPSREPLSSSSCTYESSLFYRVRMWQQNSGSGRMVVACTASRLFRAS